MGDKETRGRQGEIRTTAAGGKKKIVGYAAVFGKPSEDMGFIEYIRPGAFKNAIGKSDARALFNHDKNTLPLGRQSAGTLMLREDATGLYYEITPPDTQGARDLMVSIDRGDVRESSFAFIVERDQWSTSNGKDIRTIWEVREILDVSPVLYPAYPDTAVALERMKKQQSGGGPGLRDYFRGLEKEELDLHHRMHREFDHSLWRRIHGL